MSAEDIEFARMLYLVSSLAALLFASIFLRGLWRPLRFCLLALAFSLFFTPFFVSEKTPTGEQQNIVPAFVVMIYDVVVDKGHHIEAARRGGNPIMAVAAAASVLALLLVLILPKPRPKRRYAGNNAHGKQPANPYLPDDFATEAMAENPHPTRKNNNPYLPDDYIAP